MGVGQLLGLGVAGHATVTPPSTKAPLMMADLFLTFDAVLSLLRHGRGRGGFLFLISALTAVWA